ncbi:MAG: homoserine dehydrogenase [Planctomycetota bacterium]|nr:MAG: homoserine dehydrogenase [Planctomycetota bacterium]
MAARIGIGLVGCGVVGEALARMLLEQRAEIAARTGLEFELRHVVVRDPAKRRGVQLPGGVVGPDTAAMLADRDVRIVVELMGGTDRAREMVLSALSSGKDVVTANKALLAVHGREVFAAARAAGRCVAFEAAVAGGIPLIESVRRGLIGNDIEAAYGILNGTCNYILTRMLDNNASYAHALAEAQRLGYAEADPTLDVDGTDSAHKLTILASIAMRRSCELARVRVSGIAGIELIDLASGRELGYVCKLLATARQYEDGLDLTVEPTFVPKEHPLAAVAGPFNAVSVYGSAAGHTFYYGRGAGGAPTASAVLSDMIEVASGNAGRVFAQLAVLPDQTPPPAYRPAGETVARHYLRIGLADRPGGIGRIASTLGAEGISIATITQHEPPRNGGVHVVPVIVTTHPVKRCAVDRAIRSMTAVDGVVSRPVCIPVFSDPGGGAG